MTEKSLRNAAKEMNKVLGLEPKLDIKGTEAALRQGIKECLDEDDLITDEDEFTKATQAVLDELAGEEDAPKPKKGKGKKKPAPAPEPDDDDDDDDDEEDEEEDEDDDDDEEEDEEEDDDDDEEEDEDDEEDEPPAKKKGKSSKSKSKKKSKDDDEDDDEPPAKKKSPFKSTKETLGTTRMIECAKAMNSIKKSKDVDAIAEIADKAFVKAGGATNVKQSKNIIKVLLPAAEEWGVVVNKEGKLSNP